MVKLPDPVQALLPVRVQVPVIVLPLTAPDRVKVLPLGVDDCTVMPNLPLTLPLKFPPHINEPLSVLGRETRRTGGEAEICDV